MLTEDCVTPKHLKQTAGKFIMLTRGDFFQFVVTLFLRRQIRDARASSFRQVMEMSLSIAHNIRCTRHCSDLTLKSF